MKFEKIDRTNGPSLTRLGTKAKVFVNLISSRAGKLYDKAKLGYEKLKKSVRHYHFGLSGKQLVFIRSKQSDRSRSIKVSKGSKVHFQLSDNACTDKKTDFLTDFWKFSKLRLHSLLG